MGRILQGPFGKPAPSNQYPAVFIGVAVLLATLAGSAAAQTGCPDTLPLPGANLTISPTSAQAGDVVTFSITGTRGETAALAVSLGDSGASYRGQPLMLGADLEVLFTCPLSGPGSCSEQFEILPGLTGTFFFQAGRSNDPTFRGGTFSLTNGACLTIAGGAAGTPPPPTPGSTVPAELVGEWSIGGVSATNFYNPATGAWADPSMSSTSPGASWKFNADGTYERASVLKRVGLYGCLWSFFSYRRGTITVQGSTLVLRPSEGAVKQQDTCNPSDNYDRPNAVENPDTFTWRLSVDSSSGAQVLILVAPDGTESGPYRRQ